MNTTGKVLAGLALVGAGGIAGAALTPSDANSPSNSEPVTTLKIDASGLDSSSDSQGARSTSVGDRDCTDFSTHDDAQSFFLKAGTGDPHKLDRDADGIACETLP